MATDDVNPKLPTRLFGPTQVPKEVSSGGVPVPAQDTSLDPANPMNPPTIQTGPRVRVGKEGTSWDYNND